MFGEPISKNLPIDKALFATAHVMAKVNHLNAQKTDGFMETLIAHRYDLRGLSFRMGDECRSSGEQAAMFAFVVNDARTALARAKGVGGTPDQLWTQLVDVHLLLRIGRSDEESIFITRTNRGDLYRASVAALVQILMPEPENFRVGLPKYLSTIPHVDATKALAKLAIFSAEEEIRMAAIDGLRTRRDQDYTDILMEGFRYPLPDVSKRAAEALVKLSRRDLIANLVNVLEQPDPRLPVTEKHDDKDVTFVRELVRLNHNHNCLLCHAPGNTDKIPERTLKVPVPLPSEPFPKASEYYQSTPSSPDIVIRLDMTYLRQDFSLMMPVKDAHPWPEKQRFDFLVRTRTLTAAESQAYESCCEADEPGRLSPYRRAALFALRELTGRDTEPTAAAWRKLLRLPAAQAQPKRGV